MNFITKLATTALAATAIFATAPKAEASGHYCYTNDNGAELCIFNVRGTGTHRSYETLVNGQYGGRTKVICNPAHRYNYKANAHGIACFEFN